ncbi:hypothetical protein DSECCO2_596750 [anaerobic digester metagenome]
MHNADTFHRLAVGTGYFFMLSEKLLQIFAGDHIVINAITVFFFLCCIEWFKTGGNYNCICIKLCAAAGAEFHLCPIAVDLFNFGIQHHIHIRQLISFDQEIFHFPARTHAWKQAIPCVQLSADGIFLFYQTYIKTKIGQVSCGFHSCRSASDYNNFFRHSEKFFN